VYYMPGVLKRVKAIKDSAGRSMAFLTVLVREDEVEVIAFSDAWRTCGPTFKTNDLGIYEVSLTRGERGGLVLRSYAPVPD
jgi:DNA polymerase III alpha subunit